MGFCIERATAPLSRALAFHRSSARTKKLPNAVRTQFAPFAASQPTRAGDKDRFVASYVPAPGQASSPPF